MLAEVTKHHSHCALFEELSLKWAVLFLQLQLYEGTGCNTEIEMLMNLLVIYLLGQLASQTHFKLFCIFTNLSKIIQTGQVLKIKTSTHHGSLIPRNLLASQHITVLQSNCKWEPHPGISESELSSENKVKTQFMPVPQGPVLQRLSPSIKETVKQFRDLEPLVTGPLIQNLTKIQQNKRISDFILKAHFDHSCLQKQTFKGKYWTILLFFDPL